MLPTTNAVSISCFTKWMLTLLLSLNFLFIRIQRGTYWNILARRNYVEIYFYVEINYQLLFPKFTFCFDDDDPINWWIQFCRWLNQKWFQQIEIWNSIMWCDLLVNVIFSLHLCFFLVSPSVKASEHGDSGWLCLPSIHLTGAESSLSKAWVEMKATMPLPWFWIALAAFHNHFIHFHFHFGHSNSTTSDLLLTFPHEHLLPVIKL